MHRAVRLAKHLANGLLKFRAGCRQWAIGQNAVTTIDQFAVKLLTTGLDVGGDRREENRSAGLGERFGLFRCSAAAHGFEDFSDLRGEVVNAGEIILLCTRPKRLVELNDPACFLVFLKKIESKNSLK